MNIIKYRWLFFIISGLVIIPGLISLIMFGVKPSVDFTGGSLSELKIENGEISEIEQTTREIYELTSIQSSGDRRFIIKGPEMATDHQAALVAAIASKHGAVDMLRFETIGPTLSKELVQKTFVAIGIVAIVIMAYIAKQFKEWKYGVCAILAMLHDSLVLLGIFSLLGHFYGVEVDVLFVTAVLTTLSFSVHDTIVVYHRIRELKQKHSSQDDASILNSAVMGTITRSLNNSLTIILMLTSLSLLGGDSIKWFAVALLIGAVTGTYSSTCTAVPLLYTWEEASRALRKRRAK